MAERRKETGDDRPLEELYDVVPTDERRDSTCSDTEREVSALTSNQETPAVATVVPHRQVADVPPQSPKSPSAFVSPSQRIKEKSRSKTPPRSRSPPPPPPSSLGAAATSSTSTSHHASTSKPSTPVDRMLLLPTGSSSDENDESLTAKLLESQKQVQHLQQQVQDVNSMVRKQRVEIESLQTKLDLTTSQLHDMETALTHSAQNLNKERTKTSRLNEALEGVKRGQVQTGDHQEKCSVLERQLQDVTQKLATQEVKMASVSPLEEQLQIRTSKLATLEKVLGNTRRHLQDAVENVRETELHYQTKIEELEHEHDEERVELQDKLHKMEERLNKLVTESNNTVNSELSGHLMKERAQYLQRLEELVKEQKGKIDQLTEESAVNRQQVDELQCYKDRAAVNQNQLDNVQQEYNSLFTEFQSLRNDLEAISAELAAKDLQLISKSEENVNLLSNIEQLQEKCHSMQTQGNALAGNDLAETAQEMESLTLELNNALETSRSEMEALKRSNAQLTNDLHSSHAQVQTLKENVRAMELDTKKEKSKLSVPPVPTAASTSNGGQYSLTQVVEFISAIARCCERMTESAVAMVAGEMIESDIKANINMNQEQRTALGNKTVDQMVKKFSGVCQRLTYIVKHSVSKKHFDRLQVERDGLEDQLSDLESHATHAAVAVSDTTTTAPSSQDYLSTLLERCRAEILCISSDITRLDISHVETRLHSLNTALQQIDHQKAALHFSMDSSLDCYCNKLAVQAAAMFELARSVSDDVDLAQSLVSVENCLKSTSGIVTSIEDLSLRNYALLVSERLLISYELDHLLLTGQWKGFAEKQSDFTTKSLVAEALQRIDTFCMAKGRPVNEVFLNSCLNNLLQQNIGGRPSLDMLRDETTLISTMFRNVDQSLVTCIREYVLRYTSDLVNFGMVEIRDVESLVTKITNTLCKQIKWLASAGNLSELSPNWLHEQLCEACEKAKGLDPKDIPASLGEIVLNVSMLESRFNSSSSLITKRQTSTLSQSLVSEACKLAGLSSELAKKAAIPDSTESKIASLAQRLEQTDCLLSTYTSHYSDSVQQVMREVVNSLQLSLLRHQLGAGEYPASPQEQSLTQQVQQLSLQLKEANQRGAKLVNEVEHKEAVDALHDEMSLLKVEYSTELDESKRDMKMVLKSVKAEEYRLATELTEQISHLNTQLADEKRAHEATLKKVETCKPDSVSLEEHCLLKDKVRDLENCLHEMQEEFEEEFYQERRAHLAELDKCRAELLDVVDKAAEQQLPTQGIQEQYITVIDKLKAEQASLQQWIDDIREAHQDEIDALQHERDAALADEMATTQSTMESVQSSHSIALEQERGKVSELQDKANRLLQVERDLLLQVRENSNKDKRIGTLESRLSATNKMLAKIELNSTRTGEVVARLTTLNRQLTDRNGRLVDRFSQEMAKLGTANSSPADAHTLALKSQIENLSEKLRLEQVNKAQLEDQVEAMKTNYELQMSQRGDDAGVELAELVSSAEEMLLRRNVRARSRSPRVRQVDPAILVPSSPSRVGGRNSTPDAAVANSKSTAGSPRKPADNVYDLSRSKSTTAIDKRSKKPRSKRLSTPEDVSRPVMLDTNDRVFQQYQKSGGMSLADRMRKFT